MTTELINSGGAVVESEQVGWLELSGEMHKESLHVQAPGAQSFIRYLAGRGCQFPKYPLNSVFSLLNL